MKIHSAYRDPCFHAEGRSARLLLRGLLPVRGTGAPKISPRGVIFSVLSTVLGVLAFAAAPALGATTPTVTIKPVGTVTSTTAKVSGTVNPNGSPTTTVWNFQYSKDPETEGWTPSSVSGIALASEEVKGTLEGLQPSASYQVRLVAANEEGGEGVSAEPNPKFTTKPAPPTIESESASNVKATEARLEGVVNPNNQLTECHVQYGKASASENTVPCEPEVLKGFGGQGVGANVGGLEPDTPYHYRIIAKNGAGEETVGTEEEFKRVAEPPEKPETQAPEAVTNATAELHGALNPAGSSNVSWHFEYAPGGSCAAAGTISTATEGPEEVNAHSVSATVSGLSKGVEYTVCLVAENEAGTKTVGNPVSFTAGSALPEVSEESFSGVGSHGAKLTAQINTESETGSYYFQYAPASEFESHPRTTPATELSAAAGFQPATAQLEGLTPETEYRFRIIAKNAAGEPVDGKTETFTTLTVGIAGLPDGRVYEMVTPPENYDAEVYVPEIGPIGDSFAGGIPTTRPFEAAPNGEAIAYVGDPTTGGDGSQGPLKGNQYVARRRATGGWEQVPISQPSLPAPGFNVQTGSSPYQGFSPDLSIGVFATREREAPLASGAPEGGYKLLYQRGTGSGGAYVPLFTTTPRNRVASALEGVFPFGSFNVVTVGGGVQGSSPVFAGGSADFRHLLFEANDALLAGEGHLEQELAADAKQELEQAKQSNYLYDSTAGAVSLVDVLPGGTVAPNATFGGPPLSNPRSDMPDLDHAISEDGRRVFWTDLNTGVLYVREDDANTAPISLGSAQFWGATPDGRFVFYTEGGALYRFDTEPSPGQEPRETLAVIGAEVQGLLGAGDAGNYVYFVAHGVLAGENAQHESPTEGEENLYVAQDAHVSFIATLSAQDGLETLPNLGSYDGNETERGDWQAGAGDRTAEVTADGHNLVFMSNQSLTGFDNNGAEEVYVYSSAENRLSCVSCAPSGEKPSGGNAAFLPTSWSDTYLPHWISEDGDRVFFDSLVPLVAQDTNNVQDVYEWEREGTAGCAHGTAINGGCLFLLSDGASPYASSLAGEDESGNNVFIVSRAQFVPQDGNENEDLYDARVGGVPPPAPSTCSGTGCQSLPAPPPTFATPPSVTFNGIGNFSPPAPATVKPKPKSKPAKCKKGFVKKKNKCVKAKRRHKSKRANNERRAK